MDDTGTLIVLTVLLLLLGAYFSATETAFSSANRIRLKNLANKGSKAAGKVLLILDDYPRFLASILIGNNIANIVATTLAAVIFTRFLAGEGPAVSSVVMTVVILLLGDITPKTLAKKFAEEFSMFSVGLLQLILWILTPARLIFSLWEKLLDHFIHDDDPSGMTGEELITMVEESEKDGNIEEDESELIISAIEFNDAEVRDIYTPRVDVTAVDIEDSLDQIEDVFLNNQYSRLPVYQDDIDNIIGFIHQHDFYRLIKAKKGTIKDILSTPIRVPLSMKISDLLKSIQSHKCHLAIVIDEYGGTAGIVTLEDILEELVGDIYDEHDEVVEQIVKLPDGSYLIDGATDADEVFELFDIKDPDSTANTIGGFVSESLGQIPKKGSKLDALGLHFVVSEADLKRVIRLQVKKSS